MAVVATGFFDGVHLGHREVIRTLVSSARERGEEAIAVTFATHPRAVLQQDARSLRLLSSPQEKIALLKSLGVDRVEVLEFSREFSRLTAGEYLRDTVQARLGGTAIVLGYDNRLGSDNLTPSLIEPLARGLGLDVVIVPAALSPEHKLVSSTKIREALAAGQVEEAASMLGYEYPVSGVVVGGKQLGRILGYPTANMQLYEPLKLIPGRGVYLSEVETLGGRYYGMTNVGDIIETHIFDFSEDIYGLDITVRFIRRLRDGHRFESLDALKAQLSHDELACRELLG
jgi:riboflavin kinase / FMN adenylyltransferase